MKITVETLVKANARTVWAAWNDPEAIKQWNAASDDWHTTKSELDLRIGGAFSHRMEAKDGSMGFDFEGTFTTVVEPRLIQFVMDDGRTVSVEFQEVEGGTRVRETFDADDVYDIEHQRQGWQSILNNFARYVESRS